jgi:hypothetical protein
MNKYYTIVIEHEDGTLENIYVSREKCLDEYEKLKQEYPTRKIAIVASDETPE